MHEQFYHVDLVALYTKGIAPTFLFSFSNERLTVLHETHGPFSINHKKPLLKGVRKLCAIHCCNELSSTKVSSSLTLIKG